MRASTRVILSILVIGVFLLALAAFNRRKERSSMNSQILRLNLVDGDLPSLHPHLGVDLRCLSLEKALFEGLTRLDRSGVPKLAAAERVEISPCQTHYTFYLRHSLWSNGEPVLARHFEEAWKRALLPHSGCLRAEFFYIIKNAREAKRGLMPIDSVGIYAIDDTTLAVSLESPIPYFLDLLASPLCSPLYDDSLHPKVFNGPFQVKKWARGKSLTLTPNPAYWDSDSVQLKRIEVSFLRDAEAAFALFEQGKLDWIGDPLSRIPLDALPLLPKLQMQEVARTYWLSCNTDLFPLHHPKIRRALSLAVDRQALTTHVLIGEIPHDSPVPRLLSLVSSNPKPSAIELFEEGLAELGLTRAQFPPLTLSFVQVPEDKRMAETLQERWGHELGIEVRLAGHEWKTLYAECARRQYQISGCFRTAFYFDPMYHLTFFRDAGARGNWSGWEHPQFQALLSQAEETRDQYEREELLTQAETLLLEESPVIPLFVHNYKFLTHEKLQGVLITRLGYLDFKSAYFGEKIDPFLSRQTLR